MAAAEAEATAMAGMSDTSDSEDEQASPASVGRTMTSGSTNSAKQLSTSFRPKSSSAASGFLRKLGRRWKRRWFSLSGNKLHYAKEPDDTVFVVIDVSGASIAERSEANVDNSFEIICPLQKVTLQADTRGIMEDWIHHLKVAARTSGGAASTLGEHIWHFAPGSSTAFCNVCGEMCSHVTKRSLVCGACRLHVHKQCAANVDQQCKWTHRDTVPADLQGTHPHQWFVGNVASLGAKCAVCRNACNSKSRLQDYRCVWCHAVVHSVCRVSVTSKCTMGKHASFILPPHCVRLRNKEERTDDDPYEIELPPGLQPLVVFVNTKSGSNDGVRIMRMLRHLLNPLQVFDVMQAGPRPGLMLLRKQENFRALGCGGDGTFGWILQEADKLGISQCQLGLLPLGTGNDLARVLGWGAAFDDDEAALGNFLTSLESAKLCMLDRWSVRVVRSAPSSRISVSSMESDIDHDDAVSAESLDGSFDLPGIRLSDAGELRVASIKRENPLKGGESPLVERSDKAPETIVEESPVEPLNERLRAMIAEAKRILSNLLERSGNRSDSFVFLFEDLQDVANEFSAAINVLALKEGVTVARQFAAPCATIVADTEAFGSPDFLQLKAGDRERAVNLFIDNMHHAAARWIGNEPSSPVVSPPATRRSSVHESADATLPGKEVSVINNYFGIGFDAKICYDFNTLRDEHPEKCRSRLKNQMWYGMLGAQQLIARTCRNYHKRLRLECDGVEVPLPTLQGIVVLNIPSYMGGANFWGSKGEKQYAAPACDDGILEVVAIKGSTQMAVVKAGLPNITPTRLCQARHIKITILGQKPVPVQVDGEAWMEEPGEIIISQKNRVHMLCRDKEFEQRLQRWNPAVSGNTRAADVADDDALTELDTAMTPLVAHLRGQLDVNPSLKGKLKHSVHMVAQIRQKLLGEASAVRPGRISRSKTTGYIEACTNLLQALRLPACSVCLDNPDVQAQAAASQLALEKVVELSQAGAIGKKLNVMQRLYRKLGPRANTRDRPTSMAGAPSPARGSSGSVTDTLKSNFQIFDGSEVDPHSDGSRFFDTPATQGRSVSAWETDDVVRWLHEQGFGPYETAFRSAKIDGPKLLGLTLPALERLGMEDPAIIKQFGSAISNLEDQVDDDSPAPRKPSASWA
eukprot:m.268602 g.268602  ORF g.268602 m.268602 type:complete len:1147 (+) comp19295_c0_seq3:772-4212(+)